MICKACGHQNGDDSQFCSQCGLPLSIEDSLEEQAERPVLSKVVPYVIPGQETGVIPVRFDDGPFNDDLQDDMSVDALKAASGDAEPVEDGASCDASESAQDSDSTASSSEASEVACVGEPEELADEDAGEGDPDDPSDEADDPSCEASSEPSSPEDPVEGDSGEDIPVEDRLLGPAGMVSWDRDFPTAQITAVMPAVDGGQPSEGEASDPETDSSDNAADAESSNGFAEDFQEKDSDASADAAEADPFLAEDADVGSAEGADAEDSESRASKAAHGGAEAEAADCGDPSDSSGEDDDDDDDFIVVGKHGSSIDRTAKTERLERVPAPGPGSTAVIPSIKKKAPIRFSDADREKADAAGKFPVKWLKVAGAVVALAAVLFAVKLAVFNTEVPYVIDASSREARARLDSAGFEVEVESKVTDEAADGTVLSCDPECGSKQRKGATITLTVAASQTIPDVVGMDLESAREMLEEQGATNIKEAVEKSNQPENTVVSVSPAIGEPFSLDEEIILTVATTAYLPDVMGMTQEEAQKTLEEAGYVAEARWIESEKDPGTLVSTDPEPKALANLGSTVYLNIASPGPSAFLHIMEYFETDPASLSEYLKWKDFVVGGSFAYVDDWSGNQYVSQKWKRADGSTVSFTPAPYIEDDVLDAADYLGQGMGFEGVRIYVPVGSSMSLGNELSMAKVEEYMEACGLTGMSDSCTQSDLNFNGKSGGEMGTGDFICAQGTQDGKVWTILLTPDGAYIGAGGYECYEDMEPICDYVAVNEIFQK